MRNPTIDICSFSVHISDSSQDKVRQKLTPVTITTGGQVSAGRSAHFHENICSPEKKCYLHYRLSSGWYTQPRLCPRWPGWCMSVPWPPTPSDIRYQEPGAEGDTFLASDWPSPDNHGLWLVTTGGHAGDTGGGGRHHPGCRGQWINGHQRWISRNSQLGKIWFKWLSKD